jgi:hypothetical protein
MKTIKNKLFLATAILALASCADNTYLGDQEGNTQGGTGGAISFGSNTGKATRATSNTGTVAQMLDGQFLVYGVKSGASAGTDLQKVFVNYKVWDVAGHTTSNSSGWEYVGANGSSSLGTGNISLTSDQTIKYWDHSAADYRFVAGSPISAFTFNINTDGSDAVADNTIESATVTGLAGHLNPNPSGSKLASNPVYIADPVKIAESSYSTAYGTAPVTFHFTRQQARVRVGIYETIPGYVIKEISFYTQAGSVDGTNPHNVILTSGTTGYFRGATNGTATVTYNWTTPSYTFTYDDTGQNPTITTAQNWYGGKFESATPANPATPAITAITSTGTGIWGADNDMDATTTGYFTVIPTASATTAAPLLLKCNYTLLSEKDGSGETITVTGATAAIPAAFSKWKPNTSYTYIFKISDNTNGSTGNSKVGLYPITFDAVVTAEESAEGTITTVSTPSITTYQTGSVLANGTGIEYKTGTAIYLTVQNNTTGALNTLTDGGTAVGAVQVYKLTAAVDANPAPTEADMQVTAPSGTDLFTLGTSAATVDNVSLPANQHGTFTPSAAGFYAIQYLTAYDSGTVLTSGTSLTGYYTRTGTDPNYTYTVASGTADGQTTYYKPAYTYKIVKVVATQ